MQSSEAFCQMTACERKADTRDSARRSNESRTFSTIRLDFVEIRSGTVRVAIARGRRAPLSTGRGMDFSPQSGETR